MGQEPIWRLLFRFSGPAIISMMVASSYNIVDAIFIGRLGSGSLAALTFVFPLMMIYMSVAAGTGAGAASLISRRLGARDNEGATNAAGVTITLTILIGVIMTALFLPIMEPVLRLFGASGTALVEAESYMSILTTFLILNFFPMSIGNIIRAEGNPILPSAIMIISAFINIGLDPVFIFGIGPIPAMGVAGAATATVIARAVGTIIIIGYFVSGRSSFRFKPRHFLINWKIVAEIYRIGIASIVQQAAGSIVMIVINRTAASFGVVTLAVLGVIFRSFSFIVMPCVGIGQGMLPLIGYNFGANKKDRVGEVVFKAGLAATLWGLLCLMVVMVFPAQLISIFNSETEFLELGTPAFRIFSIFLFAIGLQISAAFFFQGIGKGLPSLVLASTRQIIFLLPCVLILPNIFGVTGLWVSFPIADGLSIFTTLAWTVYQFRKSAIPFKFRWQATQPVKDSS